MNVYELIDEVNRLSHEAQRFANHENLVRANSRLMALCVYLCDNCPWPNGLKPVSPETKQPPMLTPPDKLTQEQMFEKTIEPLLHLLYGLACFGQTSLDGENCTICGDIYHHAPECQFNAFNQFRENH